MMTTTLINSTPSTTILLMALCAGILLGCMFYGGLWWTIQKRINAKLAAVWFMGGFIVRTTIAVGGMYWVADGQWQRLLACLLGFLLGRLMVYYYTGHLLKRSKSEINIVLVKDKTYAP